MKIRVFKEKRVDKGGLKQMEKIVKKERTKCDVYTRVVGYITPTRQWNVGKLAEFGDRKTFKVAKKCAETPLKVAA